MDLTPGALREVTFRGALRGYNVDDVDEFVERVAVGVTALLDQLRQASERAVAAERSAHEVVNTAAAAEDTMRRTLARAQQLAEAVLAESRDEAARITEEAHESANQLRAQLTEQWEAERLAQVVAAVLTDEVVVGEVVVGEVVVGEVVVGEVVVGEVVVGEVVVDEVVVDEVVVGEVVVDEVVDDVAAPGAVDLDEWWRERREAVRSVLVGTLAALEDLERARTVPYTPFRDQSD